MEVVAQLVRASDCGSEGRGFESPQSPLCKFILTGTIIIYNGMRSSN